MGKEVFFASLAFTNVSAITQSRRVEVAPQAYYVEVTADSQIADTYFPEGFMAQWFRRKHSAEVPVYTFPRTGCQPLTASYARLCADLRVDTVLLVDGGSDSLMTGNEAQLGSIEEDWASIAAVHQLNVEVVPRRFLVVLGLGVDRFHGVSDAASLRAIAEVTASGSYLGGFSLLPCMSGSQEYISLLEYSLEREKRTPSIVGCCIRDSIQGHFGDYHSNPRTRGSKLFINPLMCQLHTFTIDAIVSRWKTGVFDTVKATNTTFDMLGIHGKLERDAERRNIPLEEFPPTPKM
eukprot:TRINITY_DN94864_c0_g1_i2.p1 TRINITY_DN94864_c0_g1~~TRINITY_DN94864_c0_g1_i2.p1  ORF type:complete len:339 (+),score=57.88 TRINITY_DN94864_c0_g1_i2:141-1019(+)